MGPGAVGKSGEIELLVVNLCSLACTAMTLQYVQGLFVPDYDPTIEVRSACFVAQHGAVNQDAYRKNINCDGEAVRFRVR